MKQPKTDRGRRSAKQQGEHVVQSIARRSGFVDVSEVLIDLIDEVDAVDDDEPKPDDFYGEE